MSSCPSYYYVMTDGMEMEGFILKTREKKKIRREQRRYSFMLPFGFELQYPLSWRWAVSVSPLLSGRCAYPFSFLFFIFCVCLSVRPPPRALSRRLTIHYGSLVCKVSPMKEILSFYNFRPSSACQLLPQNPFPSSRIFLLSFIRNAAWRAKVSFYLWITQCSSKRNISHIFHSMQ